MMRTHTCGELRNTDEGKTVEVAGWVQRVRDLGGLLFIDLRDRYGLLQIVIDPKSQAEIASQARNIPRESVIKAAGKVQLRPQEMVNPEMVTGAVEIAPFKIEILSPAKELPIPIEEIIDAGEELRLKYRYLELRRPYMQKHLEVRHKTTIAVRNHLDSKEFWEVETPFLMKSTPEGARDFIVPSRLNRGKFYALPQSPQTYKQILMVAGIDRYFQISRCFRDEDLRADRQPEFTQIDMEMSFVTQEDIFSEVESMMEAVFKEVMGITIETPFPRMSYERALAEYGSDKPDVRFGLKLNNVTDILTGCGFRVFDSALENNGVVTAIGLENIELSRKQIDDVNSLARQCGLAGIVAGKWSGETLNAPLNKFLNPEKASILQKQLLNSQNGTALFAAGNPSQILPGMGKLRLQIAKMLDIRKEDGFHSLWVTEFPLFELDEQGEITSSHHPFTSPLEDDLIILHQQPLSVRSKAYDLVINGYEVASGSIRIHKRELQEQIFALLGINKEEAESKFGFLLQAFEYGVPPHGGIAFGMDRLVMLMRGCESIREVIPFPKTTSGISKMDGSPSIVSQDVLEDLGFKLVRSEPESLVFEISIPLRND